MPITSQQKTFTKNSPFFHHLSSKNSKISPFFHLHSKLLAATVAHSAAGTAGFYHHQWRRGCWCGTGGRKDGALFLDLFVSTSQHLGFKYLVDDIHPLGLMLLKGSLGYFSCAAKNSQKNMEDCPNTSFSYQLGGVRLANGRKGCIFFSKHRAWSNQSNQRLTDMLDGWIISTVDRYHNFFDTIFSFEVLSQRISVNSELCPEFRCILFGVFDDGMLETRMQLKRIDMVRK